ncbi:MULTISPECIES: hypothetical protein [unclassified Roseofilum]|nr:MULTISPECIES: hypothetical protein [unclassified Roseofilum]HBR00352.1 isochorismate synthase [Cyanobacteria bacterium UBA11691]MBP0011120.1 isochorismate synthase [Roseofilum sp. Belize Diploria]MBP0014081.1 isochorismate synthase [Roseofilum sp. SID3]MBP0026706.1 isochorismate synthase [Roseofilum sp. SID2]MBP0035529.1 isochorismate synthase [Roseofilum sp. Belize BBD 4]
MNMFSAINDMVMYMFDAIGEIFSPNRDQYPSVGVQPFNGESLSEWIEF